jgi:hypothetical protein
VSTSNRSRLPICDGCEYEALLDVDCTEHPELCGHGNAPFCPEKGECPLVCISLLACRRAYKLGLETIPFTEGDDSAVWTALEGHPGE